MDKNQLNTVFSLVRRQVPLSVAQAIVGVQPMTIINQQHRSWKSYLNSLSSRYMLWKQQGYKDYEGESDATELMQQRYPGNYKLVERYNTTRGVFELDIVFENPKEEMLWRIKWE